MSYRPRVVVKMIRRPIPPPPEGEVGAVDRLGALRAAMPDGAQDLQFRPLFEMPGGQFERLTARAFAIEPKHDMTRLDAYFVAEVPANVDPAELVKVLNDAPDVELAYVEGRPAPPPFIDPADDDLAPMQRYLSPAPDGIDAEYAWPRAVGGGFTGGDGAGLRLIDIEQGWTLDHEDLQAANVTLVSGLNLAFPEHGTSVLGEIVAVDNDRGCVGIAPAVSVSVVSQWRSASTYSTSEAIMEAINHLSAGDVLLLEAQTWLDPLTGSGPFVPVETEPAVFDVIRLATSLGIVVVEAGGNGGVDLDTYNHAIKGDFLNRSSTSFDDSGAILVGAATSNSPHTRLDFSCYGSRVDCYAWGENVQTATSPSTTAYTAAFGGTSSASPIIAGAAVLVQAIAEANLGHRFDPLQLRTILSEPANGTTSGDPASDRIGVMPNLRAIIDNVLNLAPGVAGGDHDGGTEIPHAGELQKDVI